MKPAPYLIGRIADPTIALIFGISSYYLYERNTGRPENYKLNNLLREKYLK
ncbi:uncharacterized protein GVI51_F02233 [Nakaseomyces glabratus]|uniref:Non-classical export protein 1 n=1 Tax=Candida glabrata (strain ATCC 2001 / BCRC 20586 / JCM 3761 / NBRC 0622 / NRRL Y-65 / CBS 138) TaxID=284593 RepID=B4UMZ6_CANGA|nr:uncharacterized protein CAGL0F02513g [Nakaseomyces glabratus]KAH7587572.1 Non-classical export protein 1 [Nakaseomyces glabratus]KAH7589385.1 Non-classical export protein 1 [Nakaseomyces glabratus]KAH7594556.1 Non-classical export protein 1 [Nakaseomyces glabratus]KAH7604055.1 Non-classical export protein 1 [Nakaseomyces glabratus]KAH7605040.1 Non-classical export protein 1 [Nakaseomyces glabratus]|eukprot:XP_002999538.1 uncharacterized protein CAGL0F02513g [[Candida] glabrata]